MIKLEFRLLQHLTMKVVLQSIPTDNITLRINMVSHLFLCSSILIKCHYPLSEAKQNHAFH